MLLDLRNVAEIGLVDARLMVGHDLDVLSLVVVAAPRQDVVLLESFLPAGLALLLSLLQLLLLLRCVLVEIVGSLVGASANRVFSARGRAVAFFALIRARPVVDVVLSRAEVAGEHPRRRVVLLLLRAAPSVQRARLVPHRRHVLKQLVFGLVHVVVVRSHQVHIASIV
eukprot:CAMPEP_0185607928 /NCGR_PEP_ID=MMETSP0436-20130131/5847_1 /TAXON_ID=626734 ORGANISM="Favella taraikaensis, Strain Fe Narragansett Bay" /NCGR_SAMPLE_ID=MMETSP0436 /ASSEMBLY_ACC=CAM_ASM_000390 /LENGTH=168 /DNA_ID=CAMNT_0028240013 /DNA_START=2144 /DNA_END=2650 /DNA_ORIENTATION=-